MLSWRVPNFPEGTCSKGSCLILSYLIINKIWVYKLFKIVENAHPSFPEPKVASFVWPTVQKNPFIQKQYEGAAHLEFQSQGGQNTPHISALHIYHWVELVYFKDLEEGSVPKHISIHHFWCILSSTLKFEMCWPFIFFGIHSLDFGLSTPLRISLLKHNLPLSFILQVKPNI